MLNLILCHVLDVLAQLLGSENKEAILGISSVRKLSNSLKTYIKQSVEQEISKYGQVQNIIK